MKIDCAKTTARRLGFSRDLRDHAVVGYCVAASLFPGGMVLAVILFRAAIAAYGAAAALIALGAFGLNLLSVRLATLVRTDMPLALVIFLLGLLIWQKIRAREPWQPRERWEMFALLTASMFIKGPIVFAFLLPGIVVFQWLAGKRSEAECMVWLVAMDCVSRVVFSLGDLRHQVRPRLL